MKTQLSVPLCSKGPEEHMSTVEILCILAAGLCLPGSLWALNSLCSKVSATPSFGGLIYLKDISASTIQKAELKH